MTLPVASVVVASRGRPAALRRLLTALRFQDHPAFEVVVVSDEEGAAILRAPGVAPDVKHAPFGAANLSAARNRGIAQAAGAAVAFIDDDAVPEPSWLRRLTAPLAEPDVGAAGGFVRGRNGLSFQWTARQVDGFGVHAPLDVDPEAATVLRPGDGWAVKTEGTNCAFRRDVLVRLGGFDEAFRFYLDETDLNWRLAEAGWATAIVPRAEVHHMMAAGPYRRADRVPRDLFEIGASQAYYCTRHGTAAGRDRALGAFHAAQRRRVLTHMVAGRVEPRDVRRLMTGLEAGLAEGASRAPRMARLTRPPAAFRPFAAHGPDAAGVVLAGRRRHWPRLRAEAAARAAAGEIVTVLELSFSPAYHRAGFADDGYWWQRGGVYGRALRDAPRLRPATLSGRAMAEARRIAQVRPVSEVGIDGAPPKPLAGDPGA
ncbi:glycosyltransferase family 2 protein [Rhodovulum sp. YNF3179]|uniref:glycosyltransferase family 2 protein n=1 Tax=Rhodovulum sp. YNF3179 TaxID=3425127 RepID=UPI003D347A4C